MRFLLIILTAFNLSAMKLSVELSDKMASLFYEDYDTESPKVVRDVRYRVAHSGRGGQKSYGFADMATVRMCQRRTDVAVCRELKTTIKGSVHKVICERIKALNVADAFDINDNKIQNRSNGSAITYQHLHDNYTEVKGLEGTDICWIFEGHDLQKKSWDILDPTIRRTPRMVKDPEIWIEFNPDLEDDFVYQHFVIEPPEDAYVIQTCYLENPWCPQSMIDQANACKVRNIDDYNHIWLGQPRNVGALIYPTFDPDVHVRDVDMGKLEHIGMFFMGQDPHTAYYPACIWLGRIDKGDSEMAYVIYNEFPTRAMMDGQLYHEIRKEKKCTLTLKQRAKMFKALDNTLDRTYRGIEIAGRGIDTRFAKGSGATSTTNNTRGIIIEMADHANGGLTFETPPEYMIDVQRDNIRNLLSWNDLESVGIFNEPHMFIMSHCENMIDTFKSHRFDITGKEKEDEKRKDMSDALKITLATAQQIAHVDRTAKVKEYAPEPDRVKDLVKAYMG